MWGGELRPPLAEHCARSGGRDSRATCQIQSLAVSNAAHRRMTDLAHILAAWDASQPPAAAARSELCSDTLTGQAPRLRRLVHRLLGWPKHTAEVDDIVQEALLAAWRHRASFRGDAAWTTWLHRIAMRKAQNHVRAAAVRRRLLGFWHGERTEQAEPAAPPANQPDERIDATQQALQRLAHRDREVLVLRYLEQREIEQIAALLRCSRAAVDARLTRARQRLRAELGLAEDA